MGCQASSQKFLGMSRELGVEVVEKSPPDVDDEPRANPNGRCNGPVMMTGSTRAARRSGGPCSPGSGTPPLLSSTGCGHIG
jgi:hypothetical protein